MAQLRKDGKVLRMYLTVTSLKDDDGKIVGFLGIGQDITETAELQERILHRCPPSHIRTLLHHETLSWLGEGTTFTVKVPVWPEDEES